MEAGLFAIEVFVPTIYIVGYGLVVTDIDITNGIPWSMLTDMLEEEDGIWLEIHHFAYNYLSLHRRLHSKNLLLVTSTNRERT